MAAGGDRGFGGRVRRAATPTKLLAQGATAAALARVRVMRGDSAEDIAMDPRMVKTAEELARSLGEMKGAAMKIGQALSFVDVSLIPKEYRSAFALLQADAPQMSFDKVVKVVEAELGAPIGELFDWFSPKAIAAASIGQVHMAHLGEREVVVKVQYPGIAKAVEADLKNAALLSGIARLGQKMLVGLLGDVDLRAVIDEIRERVGEELDYRIEAQNQIDFRQAFAGDPHIHIPEVIVERSSERVLTTEYADGMRWGAALQEPEELRDRWGTTIARFGYSSIYRHTMINVDAHPGNYLFHEDGTVTFLDFGCVSRYTPERRDQLFNLGLSLVQGDDDAIMENLVEVGILRKRDFNGEVLLAPLRRSLQPFLEPQPFRYSREFLEEIITESLKLKVGVDELKLLQRIDMPKELTLLIRSSIGLEAILSHLEAAVNFDDVFQEIFGDRYQKPKRS